MAEVKSYKVLSLPSNPTPDSIYWVKGSSASDVVGYITDRQGVPYPLKDLQGSGGITTLVNTDGNLVIIGADNKVINLAPALLSVINSALQSGANISELVNDEGFITIADLPTKTSELINDGSDATSTYVEADELGAVAFSNDYNDLDNKPTIPTVITNHSGLSLDDGTNPHGTTKTDVGLGNVPNVDTSITSNISEGSNLYFTTARVLATVLSGLSLATGGAIVSTDSILVAFGKIQKQIDDLTTSIGNKLNKDTTAGVERAYIINADGSQCTKATSDFKDVLEFANLASFPTTGESGKIYLALDTNKTYRWSGSVYVQLGGGSEEIWNTSRYANWRILKAEALGGNQAAITFTNSLGFLNTGTATNKTSTYNTGNFIDTIRRIGLTSAATVGAEVQRRITSGVPCSMKSGFYFCADTISEDAATVANAADLVGLGANFSSPFGNTEPSNTNGCVLLAYDSTDTNMQIMHNDSAGTCTKIDLGFNFPARTNATDLYRLELYCAKNGIEIKYRVTRLNTGQQVSGTLTTNIPTPNMLLTLGFWRGNRSTALAVTKSFSQITIATPY